MPTTRVYYNKPVNRQLIERQLLTAINDYTGFQFDDTYCEIESPTVTENAIQAVIDVHDKDEQTTEQLENQVRAGAKTEFNNVPQYARMTGQEMSDWIDSNVSDLPSAKTVLKAMARMIAALRNEIYPDLEGSD